LGVTRSVLGLGASAGIAIVERWLSKGSSASLYASATGGNIEISSRVHTSKDSKLVPGLAASSPTGPVAPHTMNGQAVVGLQAVLEFPAPGGRNAVGVFEEEPRIIGVADGAKGLLE